MPCLVLESGEENLMEWRHRVDLSLSEKIKTVKQAKKYKALRSQNVSFLALSWFAGAALAKNRSSGYPTGALRFLSARKPIQTHRSFQSNGRNDVGAHYVYNTICCSRNSVG